MTSSTESSPTRRYPADARRTGSTCAGRRSPNSTCSWRMTPTPARWMPAIPSTRSPPDSSAAVTSNLPSTASPPCRSRHGARATCWPSAPESGPSSIKRRRIGRQTSSRSTRSRRDVESKVDETKRSVAQLESRKRTRKERRQPDVTLLTQRHNLAHFEQQASRLDREIAGLHASQHRRASHLAAHGADRIELDAIGEVLDSRVRDQTNRAVADPPGYITKILGTRPANGANDRAWVSAVVAIERYRVENDITDRRTAIGPEPNEYAARPRLVPGQRRRRCCARHPGPVEASGPRRRADGRGAGSRHRALSCSRPRRASDRRRRRRGPVAERPAEERIWGGDEAATTTLTVSDQETSCPSLSGTAGLDAACERRRVPFGAG